MRPHILSVLALLLPMPARGAEPHLQFAATFAPSEGWVKPSERPYRQDLCLNGLWQFQPQALPDKFRQGTDPAPVLAAPSAAGWEPTPIRIPSPWNVNSFADKNGQGGDFCTYPSYPREWDKVKMGWLRKTFSVPASWSGRRVQLHFQAVAGDAEVVVNGKSVGHHFGIFLPFDVDVTESIVPGKDNELQVGIRKASLFDHNSEYGRRTYQGGSFWGQHIAGIWQDVYLVVLPDVRAADVYIKPRLDADTLEAEVSVTNDSAREVEVMVSARACPWISKAGNDVLTAPVPSSELGAAAALEIPAVAVKVPAHGNAKVVLSALVNSQLKCWSPERPTLYGLVVTTRAGERVLDSHYTRFGWRQLAFNGGSVLLNGKPLLMKGDSWHFLGIPQMTRRYPWAWFTAMRAANLNAVRFHAQPYPSFYLDVADEMGILVLDETAVWASDGGPALNEPAYWEDTKSHLAGLVMRDRNHPCVFGWSVSNEVKPIVAMMHSPPGMQEALVKHYELWADICRKLDPTRQWISADGEDDGAGKLPSYVIHYGDASTMKRAENSGKPWGVGEAGMAYYGTPEQVAAANGGRAYESFQGRMEGIASSSYQSLVDQREHHASYRSVFNMVWYGLKPLPLGLKDTSKAPTLDDGVYFTRFTEGAPGVQPERLGPYCTTLNPGYAPNLPLYLTWPLFDAIRDACAEPPVPCKWTVAKPAPPAPAPAPVPAIASAKVLAAAGSVLAADLKRTGVPWGKLDVPGVPVLLFIDGTKPPAATAALPAIQQVLAKGGTVVVWGVSPDSLAALNPLLPAALEITARKASSLRVATPGPVTAGLTPADLYFSEMIPPDVVTQGLAGPLVARGTVLLAACDTNWLKWNKQDEYAKTAMVLRTELELKPSGAVLIATKAGAGRLLVTTLPAAPRLDKQEKAVRAVLANLGIPLGSGSDVGKPLLKSGEIVRALLCGSFPAESVQAAATLEVANPAHGERMVRDAKLDGKPWKPANSQGGMFDFGKLKFDGPRSNSLAYLSFWVSSPRPLDNLLLEPNIPVVGLEVAADDAVQVWVNGQQVVSKIRSGPIDGGKASAAALKLHQGWNHVLIKVIQGSGGWQFTGRLTCSQPDFLGDLESSFEKP